MLAACRCLGATELIHSNGRHFISPKCGASLLTYCNRNYSRLATVALGSIAGRRRSFGDNFIGNHDDRALYIRGRNSRHFSTCRPNSNPLGRVHAFLSDPSSSSSTNGSQSGSMFNGRLVYSTSSANGSDAASLSGQSIKPVSKGSESQVADTKILRTLASYLWMKDNAEFRLRVIMALGFLVGAKILNVQVPFLFKLAVDWLTTASGNAAALASFTAANSTMLTLFATPAAVLVGYGIARSGAAAFNGTRHESFGLRFSPR